MFCAVAVLCAAPGNVLADTLASADCQTEKSSFVLYPDSEAMITGLAAMRQPGKDGEACGDPQPGKFQNSNFTPLMMKTEYVTL